MDQIDVLQCLGEITQNMMEILDTGPETVSADLENINCALDNDLPRDVMPFNYDLELQLLQDDDSFRGRVNIEILCNNNTSTVVLHADQSLQIPTDEVEFRKVLRDEESPLVPIKSITRESSNQHFAVVLDEELVKENRYLLTIPFSGPLASSPQEEGLYRNSYVDQSTGEKSWYIATNVKPGTARKIFPCFDPGDYKMPTTVRVAQHQSSNQTIVSISRLADQKSDNPWVWKHFGPVFAMFPSSVGIVKSDLELQVSKTNHLYVNYENNTNGYLEAYGQSYLKKPLESLLDKLLKELQKQQDYFNVKLPMETITVVALPELGSRTRTSWGLIQIAEHAVQDTVAVSNALLDLWFDHLYTALPNGTSLRRCLNDFMLYQTGVLSWRPDYALYYGLAKPHIRTLLQSSVFDNIKRQWTLRMLNYSLTEDVFRSGFRRFMLDRMYSVYTDGELWEFLYREADVQGVLKGSFLIEDLVNAWSGSWRYPIVTVTRNYADNTAVVEQHAFIRERPHYSEEYDYRWMIPIMYLTPDNLDPNNISAHDWIDREKQVTIDGLPGPDDFIIVNPEEIGLFVVNYDERNWNLLSQHLQSSRSSVPELTRAKLVHDAWNAGYGGELHMVAALNVSLFLAKETLQRVWDPFLNVFDHVHRYLSGTAVGPKLEKYILKLLLSAKSLGANWVDGTRAPLIVYGHEPDVARARQIYSAWMNSSDHTLHARMRRYTLLAVFGWGTMEEYEFGLDQLIKHPCDTMLLRALAGSARQQEKVYKLLQAVFVDEAGKCSDDQVYSMLVQLSSNAAGWTAWFDFLSNNWDNLKNRYAENTSIWNTMVHLATHHIITQEGFDKLEAFLSTHKGEFGSAENKVQEARIKAAQEVEWTNKNLASMDQWLDGVLSEETA